MISSPLLPLAYDNGRVEPLIRGRGWAGVINSPLLPLPYDNSIVQPLISGGVDRGD